MLVLSRKAEQKILIGPDVVLTVMVVKGNLVKIGIEAPRNVRVLRSELLNQDSESKDSTDCYAAPRRDCYSRQIFQDVDNTKEICMAR